jgi:hypothetical protein
MAASKKTNQSTTYDQKTGKWTTRATDDWTPQERKRFGVSATGNIDSRTANAILRERRGVKLGGVDQAGIDKAETDAYNKALAQIRGGSTGGGTAGGYGNLLSTLRGLGDYAAGNINSSMDNLSTMLQGQSNPYSDFKAQQTQTTPELSQLLQSQGVSQDPLQQFATAMNAQNQNQATAFQNQADIMSKIYGANQAGSIGDVAQQRAGLLNQLQGNVFGTGASLMGKKAPDRNAVLQMILEAMKVQR